MPPAPVSLEVLDSVGAVAKEWDDLAERTAASPFVRPAWIDAWWTSFGGGKLRILAARRDGALIGIMPLEWRRGALRTPTNEHTPAFDLLAADEEAARVIAGAVFAGGVRAVTIERLNEDGPTLTKLRAALHAAGYRDAVRPVARSAYIRCAPSLVEHERSLSRNLRHDVQRRLRRLCETGAVSFEIADGSERLDELLDEGFAVEERSWKGAGGTAIGSDSRTRRFYRDVAHWASPLGWLRLAFLRLDGRAIAFQFDLEAGRTYYSLKIGYDPTHERFSPGKLLAHAMVSRAVSIGLDTYELLGTDEAWKYRWTETFHERVSLHAFSRSPAGLVAWSAFAHGRPLARRLPFASRFAAAVRR
jgi:CelD/BcsL family acetyltransferase involved in cellulose biosynthesis